MTDNLARRVSGGIFVLNGEDLVAMHEQPYDSEDLLQTLLAKYPELIAGDDDVTGMARRWLVVKREGRRSGRRHRR